MTLILSGSDGVSDIDGSASTPAIRGTDANTGIFFPAADTIAFAEGGAEAMRIDSDGDVGIGTTSPGYKLEAAGTIAAKFANPDTNGLRVEATTGTNAAAMRFVNTGGNGYVGLDNSTGSRISGSSGAGYSLNLWHEGAYPILFGTGNAERMRIDSSGNVGIGTSSTISQAATTNLQVYGTTNANLRLQSATTGVTGADGLLLQSSAGEGYIWNLENNFISFGTNNAERARITSGGNFLIGTTSTNPVADRVNGNALLPTDGLRVRCGNASSYFGINVSSGVNLTFYTDNGSAFVTGGNISTNGGTTSYNGTSDYRLKDNIQPLTNALETVSKLKPCTFTWKVDGRLDNGFIAHELQEVLPNAVTGEKDAIDENGSIKPQGVDPRNIVATLTAAIQELKAELDEAKARIEALENNNV